jgi:hypothetical protein
MDDAKDRANRVKHGVSFARAQATFFDPKTRHRRGSGAQRRGAAILLLWRRRWWHHDGAIHSSCRIRIFGAGYWRKGKRIYEQQSR